MIVSYATATSGERAREEIRKLCCRRSLRPPSLVPAEFFDDPGTVCRAARATGRAAAPAAARDPAAAT